MDIYYPIHIGCEAVFGKTANIAYQHGLQGGYINNKHGGYDLVFSHNDSLALYRLMYHTAGTSNLYLPRKREKLERAVNILHLDHVRE